MRFTDRVVVVTGAARGIGLATALRLGSEGARVVLADLDAESVAEAAQAVHVAGAADAWGAVCDVSDEAAVERLLDGVVARWGRLDGVVNNAGVMSFATLAETTATDWHRVLGVDLLGAFYFLRGAFRRMDAGGAIVNVSSVHAWQTTALVAPYAAAKAALVSLTHSGAVEGREMGIRVNAVLPGAVSTAMLWDNPNVRNGVEDIDPADVGTPEQVAATIAYLLSDDAGFVTGETLRVDGGRLARL